MNWIVLAILSSVMFYASAWLFNRVTSGGETITRTWIAVAVAFSAAIAPLAFVVACCAVVVSVVWFWIEIISSNKAIKDWFNKDI